MSNDQRGELKSLVLKNMVYELESHSIDKYNSHAYLAGYLSSMLFKSFELLSPEKREEFLEIYRDLQDRD